MNIVCILNTRRTGEHITSYECGCQHTDILWLAMCKEHATENAVLHALAAQEHQENRRHD